MSPPTIDLTRERRTELLAIAASEAVVALAESCERVTAAVRTRETSRQRIDTTGAPIARRGYQGGAVRDRDPSLRRSIDAVVGLLDAAAVTRAWDEVLEVPDWNKLAVWVHGDLLAPNVLPLDGSVHAIIDFGNACAGDPAIDLAAAWSLFGPACRRHFRSVLDADEATWTRARGWALTAVMGVADYTSSNPTFAADCRHRVEEALADI